MGWLREEEAARKKAEEAIERERISYASVSTFDEQRYIIIYGSLSVSCADYFNWYHATYIHMLLLTHMYVRLNGCLPTTNRFSEQLFSSLAKMHLGF